MLTGSLIEIGAGLIPRGWYWPMKRHHKLTLSFIMRI
jgi:hypothetical protein